MEAVLVLGGMLLASALVTSAIVLWDDGPTVIHWPAEFFGGLFPKQKPVEAPVKTKVTEIEIDGRWASILATRATEADEPKPEEPKPEADSRFGSVSDRLAKLTVKELRGMAKGRGLKMPKAKKADLVKALAV